MPKYNRIIFRSHGVCHNERATPGATKKAIKIASFIFTPTHFYKVMCMCMKRQEKAEPIGKVRAGQQSSFPETEWPEGLHNEGGTSLKRTPDEGSKRQGKLLLTISQLDVYHPGFPLCLPAVILQGLFSLYRLTVWIMDLCDPLLTCVNSIPPKLHVYTKPCPGSRNLRPLEAPLGD